MDTYSEHNITAMYLTLLILDTFELKNQYKFFYANKCISENINIIIFISYDFRFLLNLIYSMNKMHF
jgi:hypothetical protein